MHSVIIKTNPPLLIVDFCLFLAKICILSVFRLNLFMTIGSLHQISERARDHEVDGQSAHNNNGAESNGNKASNFGCDHGAAGAGVRSTISKPPHWSSMSKTQRKNWRRMMQARPSFGKSVRISRGGGGFKQRGNKMVGNICPRVQESIGTGRQAVGRDLVFSA
jgi:hypothetical protein